MSRAPLVLLLCLAAAAARGVTARGEPMLTPTQIDTCSNSTTDTAPQISRVQTCARAAVTGYGLDSGVSVASSQAGVLRVAATACGDAVAGSIGELCAGKDPMATIFSLARTCGTAMAALYTRALTGSAVFDMSPKVADAIASKAGRLEACGSSCSTAQGAAEAFAQAAACGVASATDACLAATTQVQTSAFTRAFVKSTADAWGKACTTGAGLAHSGGNAISAAAAASIAQAMGAVAAQACANCPTCKCKKLPLGAFANLNDAGDFSNAAAHIVGGRVGLAHAIADATTTYCKSDGSMEKAKVQARAVLNTLGDLVIGAAGAARGSAAASGSNAWACGSGSLSTELAAVQDVSSRVLADAAATIFNGWCPSAAAKFDQLEVLTDETLNKVVQRVAEKCSFAPNDKGGPKQGDAKQAVLEGLRGNKPLVKKLAEALTAAKSCGCTQAQNRCLWCDPGQAVATPLALAKQHANVSSVPKPQTGLLWPASWTAMLSKLG